MNCAIVEEHSSSCVVYSRFSGTLFPVSMIDGEFIASVEVSNMARCSSKTNVTDQPSHIHSISTHYYNSNVIWRTVSRRVD